ncbi:unnamed protein product, partial [Musa banksii]
DAIPSRSEPRHHGRGSKNTHTASSAASAISLSGAAAQLRGVFRSFDFLLNMLSASSSFLSPFQTSCSASRHLPSFG